MGVTEIEFEPTIFSEDNGFTKHPKIKAGRFRTKQVCKPCNNEWMSELEVWFEKRLGLLVESSWPRHVAEIIQNLRNESDPLIRWMIKTAVVFEKASPKGNQQAIPDAVRIMAKDGNLSGDFLLMIGRIQVPRLTAQLTKGFPVWKDDVYHNYQVHEHGFSFTVCLNHLAIRIVKCPDASPMIKPHITAKGVPAVPFWIKPPHHYPNRVTYLFSDFQSFSNAFAARTN